MVHLSAMVKDYDLALSADQNKIVRFEDVGV